MKNIDWQRAETDIEYRKAVNVDLSLMNALLDRRSVELECTRKVLREICRDYGDNDWPDNLYVPDIIEKHLWRNLDGGMEELEEQLDEATLERVKRIMLNAYELADDLDSYPSGTNCNRSIDLDKEIEYAAWETQGYREPVHKS